MAITLQAWPFENVDTTEAQYGRLFKLFQEDGIADVPTTGAGVVSAGSGFTVNIAAVPLAFAGGLAAVGPAGSVTLDTAGAQARVDRIVLRVNSTNNTGVIDKITGAPGSATPPALTQTAGGIYEIPLARITMAANALNVVAGNIVDERTFTSRRPLQYTTTLRPTMTKGDIGFNHTTGLIEYHNGTVIASIGDTSDASKITTGTLPTARLDYGVIAAFRGDRTIDAPVAGDVVNGDWNLAYQPGVYRIDGNRTNANMPAGAYNFGTLLVLGGGSGLSSRTQMYFPDNNYGGPWIRTTWNGGYGSNWQQLPLASNVYDKATADARFAAAGSGGVSTSTGSVSYASNVGANQGCDLSKIGYTVTFRFNLMINGSKPPGADSSANLLQLPSGFRPRNFPVDFFGHNSSAWWGMAIDTDGWMRLRSNSIGGGGLWGSVTFQAA